MRKTLLVSLVAIVSLGLVRQKSPPPDPARFLYVWGGTGHHGTPGKAAVVVFDVNPSSKSYGSVIHVLVVDSAGRMPHHTEFSPPANATSFFANDFGADRSWVIDFSNPASPKVAAQLPKVEGGRMMHSFARLPNGNVLATIQFGDKTVEGDPGRLAEFDKTGRLIRSGSSADKSFPDNRIRTYGITALPAIDRVVTTSSPMDDEKAADVIQVWRLSDLQLLKTLPVPTMEGDSAHRYPFELRTMADGKTAFLNSYFCGFYRITGLESEPKIEQVLSLPGQIGCAVPHIDGKLMIMPVVYAHRIATFDISNPARPVEIASIPTDPTFFPHWVSADPGSDRIVTTDQGDGPPRIIIGKLDRTTGRITWDDNFRDAGSNKPGISLENVDWPKGIKGKFVAHGALFIR